MKKNIIMIILLSMFSCNLQENTGLKSVVDDKELADTIDGNQWFGLAYGEAAGFSLSIGFDLEKATMDYYVSSCYGNSSVKTKKFQVIDKILYIKYNDDSAWEKFFRIDSYSSQNLAVYIFSNGKEVSKPSLLGKANNVINYDNVNVLVNVNYPKELKDEQWISEAINLFSLCYFLKGISSEIDKELSDSISNINNTYSNSSYNIDDIIKILQTPDPLFIGSYIMKLRFDFDNDKLNIKVYKDNILIYNLNRSFNIEYNILKVMGENNWVDIGEFVSIDGKNFRLELFTSFIEMPLGVNFSLDNDL